MSIRLEMLQAARLAPRWLRESADLVRVFLQRSQNADGGFPDRAGRSDLYYTVFGLEGLLALSVNLPMARTESYLRSFGTGAGLDLVHLCCLARCWAALDQAGGPHGGGEILRRLEGHRTPDGGFGQAPNAARGTAYGCFLALGAYQDLRAELPHSSGLTQCLAGLHTPDGVWSNAPAVGTAGVRSGRTGSTPATAAAVLVLRHLGQSVEAGVADWVLARGHARGGFRATPDAPLPDLLSTATALHALAGLGVDVGDRRETCLDFLDSLWTNQGGFHGHWADDHVDCEYTFYGLLALGHLAG